MRKHVNYNSKQMKVGLINMHNNEIDNLIFKATDEKLIQEANIIRLDAKTTKKRRLNQAALMAAKEANDPLYIKYQKAVRARNKYRELIRQKYATKANLKVAEYDALKRKNL